MTVWASAPCRTPPNMATLPAPTPSATSPASAASSCPTSPGWGSAISSRWRASRRPNLPRALTGAVRWPRRARTPPPATGKWWASTWRSPFPLYPHGFPPEIMSEFERRIGRKSLGNVAASGTEIIKELGAEHMRTGSPIVYTSADSVFQVAAHEEVIPLWELYKICETAREILRGPYEVGRVIARPFIGAPGSFTRTANRHDYAVPPPKGMLLDRLEERGVRGLRRRQDFRRVSGPGHPGIGEDQEQRRRHGQDYRGHELARCRPDLRQPGGFRPAVRPSQRYRGLRRRARAVGCLAAPIPEPPCAQTTPPSSPPTTAATPPRRAPTTRASTCRCWSSVPGSAAA